MKRASDPNENIRALLAELPEDDANAVRPLLLALQAISRESAPAPSPELADILAGDSSTDTASARRFVAEAWCSRSP